MIPQNTLYAGRDIFPVDKRNIITMDNPVSSDIEDVEASDHSSTDDIQEAPPPFDELAPLSDKKEADQDEGSSSVEDVEAPDSNDIQGEISTSNAPSPHADEKKIDLNGDAAPADITNNTNAVVEKPVPAKSLKPGDVVDIDGFQGKIQETSILKAGKHGGPKVSFTIVNPVTKQKKELNVLPSTNINVLRPKSLERKQEDTLK